MKMYKAPEKEPSLDVLTIASTRIFLAGSIEMGKAEKWQDRLAEMLKDDDVILFNPRRDDWDSSWTQRKDNPQFYEQVTWELENLDMADVVIFYFDPNTTSPITLIELGLQVGERDKKVIVCCPDGYFRKGNVDIVCERYGAYMVNSLEEIAELIRKFG
jgi:nucleoside 2-deoxyribosyltransferase